jgi:hypothetical protein
MNKLTEIQFYNERFPGKLDENLLFYFSFDSGSSIITPISGKADFNDNFLFSGQILPSVNNFWFKSGAGYIENNYINIYNTDNIIDFEDFSFVCVYENIAKTGSTLLSTVFAEEEEYFNEFGVPLNSLVYKGFEFGFTANDKLYFEFYDSEGPKVFTSDFFVGDKSAVFCNIANRNISFGYYDFIESGIVSNNFNINSQFIFNPNNIFIGKNPVSLNSYNYNKQFQGYLEQIIFCSPSIYQYEIENITKSFISNYFPATDFFIDEYLTGVTGVTTGVLGEEILLTGYLFGITGYETGIIEIQTNVVTGIEYIITGTYIDAFGNEEPGYQEVELIGDLFITGFLPLSGRLRLFESGTIEEFIKIDEKKVVEFGKDKINLLVKTDVQDIIEAQFITGNYDLRYTKNFGSFYDEVNKTYVFSRIKSDFNNFNHTIYANGVLLTSGSGRQIGTVYSPNIFIASGDYITQRKGEFLLSEYDSTHSVFADFITGNSIVETRFTKNNSGVLNINNLNEYDVFFNGQKLTSGIHYFNNNFNNFFQILGDDISGKLALIPKNFNINITGSGHLYSINRTFYNNFAKIYKNGIRQRLNFDYIENGDFSLNNGAAILDTKNNLIYNNNTLFM